MERNAYTGKNITVFGLRKSGKAAIELLLKNGAKVFATEKSAEIDSSLIIWLEELHVPFELGFHSRKAIENKDLIVLSPGVDPRIPLLEEARILNVPIIGEVELAYQFSSSTFIAVTGTSGKSTTVELIGKIISAHRNNVYVCGNIGIPISEIITQNQIQSSLIVELSSFQLETIQEFRPKVAVFLNFSEDHLDRYSSMDEYFNAKKRIFNNQTNNDFALLNADTPWLMTFELTRPKKYYFSGLGSVDKGFFLQNNHVVIREEGYPDRFVNLAKYRLKGKHNLTNAVSAIGASYLFLGKEFDIEKTEKAIANFEGLYHRYEFVGTFLGVDFINDSKSTKPHTTIVALQCINKPTILILGGSDKGNVFNEMVKEITHNPYVKYVVITGKTQKKIRSAFEAVNFKKYKTTPTFKSAVFEAIARARDGDTVLLSPACASFDEFRDFEDRGDFFKHLVRSIYSNS